MELLAQNFDKFCEAHCFVLLFLVKGADDELVITAYGLCGRVSAARDLEPSFNDGMLLKGSRLSFIRMTFAFPPQSVFAFTGILKEP